MREKEKKKMAYLSARQHHDLSLLPRPMKKGIRKNKKGTKRKGGSGIVNSIIDILPEMHVPG